HTTSCFESLTMSDTSVNDNAFSELFDLAQQSFVSFVQECEAYGIHASPALELHLENGVELSYYNFKDGDIYASLPDLTQPLGKFYKLALRAPLYWENAEELFKFLQFFTPRLIAMSWGTTCATSMACSTSITSGTRSRLPITLLWPSPS